MDENRTYEFKPVNQLVFSDDFMFGAVMQEPDICKGVLELLLQVKIDRIVYPELQKSISPFYSKKGVRLMSMSPGATRSSTWNARPTRLRASGSGRGIIRR
jgi:hypothetical protein